MLKNQSLGEKLIKINIITVGKSRSSWVTEGFLEYKKRLPKDYQLTLIEIPTIKRVKRATTKQIIKAESKKLLEVAPKNSLIIALDEHGQEWTSFELAKKISTWQKEQQQNISFLIGGPDGWDQTCLKHIPLIWSLSKLTLPHQLVRVMVAEQIYRAWSIINNHPYHRN